MDRSSTTRVSLCSARLQERLINEDTCTYRSGMRKRPIFGLLVLACLLRGQVVLSQAPRLENCRAPSTTDPWRDRRQTPECRTLELIHAMNLEEKINHIIERPKPDRFAIPSLNPADGPNGYARGPLPGPPPPSALGVTAFPNEIALAATWDRNRAFAFGQALERSGGERAVQKSSDPP